MNKPRSDSRPRTPSRSPAPPDVASPPPLPSGEPRSPVRRSSSFSFLRRGKSEERLGSKRVLSGNKLTKRQIKEMEAKARREANAVPKIAPRLPDVAAQPQLQTFGGEGARGTYGTGRVHSKNSLDNSRSRVPPVPPMPGSNKGDFVDPYARTESMTHRGRYSYASSAVSTLNSPRRVRRRKDPTPFNILVVGARNCGKTSFLDFLRASLTLPPRKQRPSVPRDEYPELNPTPVRHSPNFISHYLETEMDDGERIGLTLWDSEGLEKNMVDLQLREMASFVESKFEETFNEEMKVIRSPGVRDTHIHCVFLLLDPLRLDANIAAHQKGQASPNGHFSNGSSYLYPPSPSVTSGLDEDLDLQVLRVLQGKTTVVPIISKADTVTTVHMAQLKRTVWDSLKKANLDPLEALSLEEDDASASGDSDDEAILKSALRQVKHNSKRFDEWDEDAVLSVGQDSSSSNSNGHRNEAFDSAGRRHLNPHTSHLDSSSSRSPSRSPIPRSPARQVPGTTFPFPSGTTTASSSAADAFNSTGSGINTSATGSAGTTPYLPLSTLSPDPITAHTPGPGQINRSFPWGAADPYNTEHCDFVKLKQAVFREWRGELREASRELWYEGWRTSRLNGSSTNAAGARRRTAAPERAAAAADTGVGIAR